MIRIMLALVLSLALFPALAVEPSEILDDPVLEARAREISQQLRCVVCQNQSIDESNADLARDMRVLVRNRLLAGDGNSEVIDYMVSRYGDFVLLNPPFKASTYALWFGPGVIVLLGIFAVTVFYRTKPDTGQAADGPPTHVALNREEQQRLDKIMENDQG